MHVWIATAQWSQQDRHVRAVPGRWRRKRTFLIWPSAARPRPDSLISNQIMSKRRNQCRQTGHTGNTGSAALGVCPAHGTSWMWVLGRGSRVDMNCSAVLFMLVLHFMRPILGEWVRIHTWTMRHISCWTLSVRRSVCVCASRFNWAHYCLGNQD